MFSAGTRLTGIKHALFTNKWRKEEVLRRRLSKGSEILVMPLKTVIFDQVHVTAMTEANCSSAVDGPSFLLPLNKASNRKARPLILAECTATRRDGAAAVWTLKKMSAFWLISFFTTSSLNLWCTSASTLKCTECFFRPRGQMERSHAYARKTLHTAILLENLLSTTCDVRLLRILYRRPSQMVAGRVSFF